MSRDIEIWQFHWDNYGHVALGTETSGKDLKKDTAVELYWANGTGYV